MTRLNGQRFRPDELRLALSLLAYNLRNLWQRLFGKTAQPDGAFAAARPIGAAATRNRSGRRRGSERGVRESGPQWAKPWLMGSGDGFGGHSIGGIFSLGRTAKWKSRLRSMYGRECRV